MAYLATIVKYSRDYHGVAWAQYDRGFRKQMATLKDLRWSRLNTTLFSLCFAGKAKGNTMCAWCLVDSHDKESCPDNPPHNDWKGCVNDARSGSVARCGQVRAPRVCHSVTRRAMFVATRNAGFHKCVQSVLNIIPGQCLSLREMSVFSRVFRVFKKSSPGKVCGRKVRLDSSKVCGKRARPDPSKVCGTRARPEGPGQKGQARRARPDPRR